MISPEPRLFFFFFNDTATTEIYTLSLHDALPILSSAFMGSEQLTTTLPERSPAWLSTSSTRDLSGKVVVSCRSEEHTSELQSLAYLVCRLLLEKKNNSTERHMHERHVRR